MHNVRFCVRLVGLIRAAIVAGRFAALRDEWVPRLRAELN
jgi:queuine/archaeosine tRNA-ribosyltransferase